MDLTAASANDDNQETLRLMMECRTRLATIAFQLCGNMTDAEDLVSRTLIKVFQNLDSYTRDDNFFGWMRTIMTNLRTDDMRRRVERATQPVEGKVLEDYAGADNRTDEEILANADHDVLHEAIERLDPKYKQAVSMYYFSEFSIKEIAGILKLPIGTVSRRLQIARQILAGKLKDKLEKKPWAVAAALLLAAGTLLGAWQAGVGEWLTGSEAEAEAKEPAKTISHQQEEKTMNMKTIRTAATVMTTAVALGATAATAEPIGNGLAAYYTFDEPTPVNHVANDKITGLTLTETGITSGVNSGEFGWPGFNGYLDIDKGYAKLEGSEKLEFENGNNFTVVIWMRTEAAQSGDPVCVGNGNWNSSVKPGFVLSPSVVDSGPRMRFSYSTTGSARDTLDGTIKYGKWTFYAVSYTSDKKMYMYQGALDNEFLTQIGSKDAPNVKLLNDAESDRLPFCLGQDGRGIYGKAFVGKLDEFALWTRGLSPADINAIYQNGRKGHGLDSMLKPSVTAEETNGQVALTFAGARADAYELYVASGAADGGDDRFAWERFDRVATIQPTDTTYEYALPDAIKEGGLYYRFFLTKTAEYQEIDYVENRGTTSDAAYVLTGIKPDRDTVTQTEVAMVRANGWDNIFGCCDKTVDEYYQMGCYVNEQAWYVECTKQEPPRTGATARFGAVEPNVRYALKYTVTDVTYWNSRDEGAATVQATLKDRTRFPGIDQEIAVFRCQKTDGTYYDRCFCGKIFAFSVSTNGVTACDYIPVKNAAGVAGFYDMTTGAFHPSESATAFVGGGACVGRLSVETATLKAATASDPVAAQWIGGTDGAVDDPSSWKCQNAYGAEIEVVPTILTDIAVPNAEALFSAPAGSDFVCKSVTLGESLALAGDIDWRGIDFEKVTIAGTLDLAGHTLRVSAKADFGKETAITDTVGDGELRVEVPVNKTVASAKLALSGQLTLVKEGEGVLVANRANQANAGGVRIEGGVLKTTEFISTHVLGPEKSKVVVGACGTLRIEDGYTGLEKHALELAGGTLYILNSKQLPGRTVIGDMIQTADSTLCLESGVASDSLCDTELSSGAVWDLGGFRLTVNFQNTNADFMLGRDKTVKPVFRNGTIALPSAVGYWQDYGIDARDHVCYEYGMLHVRVREAAQICDFVNNIPKWADFGTGTLSVYGTLTPNSSVCCLLRMMDGSTIDLSGKTEPWSVSLGGTRVLAYEEGATVNVNLGQRKFKDDHKVISWEAIPAGVEFVDPNKKWTLVTMPDGLYAYSGLLILVK